MKQISTSSSTRQGSFLTCGCFCARGLIYYTTSLFRNITPSRPHFAREKDSHDTENFTPYSFRIVCGFFNVPHWNFNHGRYCETGPTVYSPYPRRLESLTTCRCNCEGSTFSSVILRPWVTVRPESNSRPPAWKPDAQPTEPPRTGGSVGWATDGLSTTKHEMLNYKIYMVQNRK